MKLPAIINQNSVTYFINLKPYTVHSSHESYDAVLAAVRDENFEEAHRLANTKAVIEGRIKDSDLKIESDELVYQGQVVRNTVATKILDLIKEKKDPQILVSFLKNLMQNPSKRAVDELYDFLEVAKLPLTEDGHFVAYKAVRDNYHDIHSGKFDNSVGQTCEMPRNAVDEDKNRTCSAGLHFAAYGYARSFGGSSSRMMAVKINPKDVVAIPSDYNNQKGRTCRYTVIAELDRDVDSLKNTTVFEEKPKYKGGFDAADMYEGDLRAFPVEEDNLYMVSRSDFTEVKCRRPTQTSTGSLVFKTYEEATGTPVYITVTQESLDSWRTIELVGPYKG